jgi:two-component system chemotaxis sensor kinase CheA
MSAPGRRGAVRASAVRLPPERLDALAVAGAALVTAAHQAEASAARLDDLAREARRLRIRARTEIRAPGAGGLEDDLRRHERALAGVRAQATQEARALERRTRRLSADIRALRLTPWSEATAGLERMVRDVAARRGSEVELALENQALEIDRAVVDVLREPLSQLVSNAIAHAIEPPDERRAAGKPPRGRVEVAARVDGERLLVTVTDDGRGLDPERLRAEARRRGIAVPAEARRALELVFLPGFSTVPAVTEEAGRGVGLDLVATAVRAKRGTVAVASTPGRGTTFELAIPATLYGLRAVLARDGGQLYALPALDVERVVRVVPEGVGRMEGRPVLLGREPLPLAPLGHAAGVDTGPWKVEDRRTALVVSAGGRRAAFAVDEVLAERELALEPLPHRAEGALMSAVSVLPGGGLALVLAAEALLEAAGGAALPAEVRPAEARRRRILLADDAATTRALARSILEAAGYEVLSAADGEQAFALLQQQGADALVSDVEMPGLDGFELARSVRATPRFARLPVVLLTALSSDADRRRGLEAGASAYLVKSAFDQRQLLDTLGELLGELP